MADQRIIAVTAPSGAGKTSIVQSLRGHFPQLEYLVSATTRPPRATETHGEDYYFVSTKEFRRMIQDNELAEYEEVYPGTFYGTLRSELERATQVLLDVDVKGALNLRTWYGEDSFTLFVRPPSIEVLETRLRQRATESADSLQIRLRRAREEMAFENAFDAVVVNDDLSKAVTTAVRLIRSFLDEG